MTNIGATSASSRVSNVNAPAIQNITVTEAVETAVTLPSNTTRFMMKLRDCEGFQIRTAAAAAEYYTVDCGNDYSEFGLSATTVYTLYITPETSGILEVLSWS